jgi:hypothetical protein
MDCDRPAALVVPFVHLERAVELVERREADCFFRSFARRPEHRQQNRNQDRDDPDNHEQFHQRERGR